MRHHGEIAVLCLHGELAVSKQCTVLQRFLGVGGDAPSRLVLVTTPIFSKSAANFASTAPVRRVTIVVNLGVPQERERYKGRSTMHAVLAPKCLFISLCTSEHRQRLAETEQYYGFTAFEVTLGTLQMLLCG